MRESPAILTVPLFSDLCNLGFRLRRRVFVEEQGLPAHEEFDPFDLTATHMVAVLEGSVCGVLRVLATREQVKIGRVAVAGEMRGRKVGDALMRRALADFQETAKGRFYLAAQADKTRFYEKFGFRVHGAIFLDGGIPHLAMRTY